MNIWIRAILVILVLVFTASRIKAQSSQYQNGVSSVEIDYDGRLLVRDGNTNTLGVVCSTFWDDTDAGVICRHLGIGNKGYVSILPRSSQYPYLLYGVHCNGSESRFEQCQMEWSDVTGSCVNADDVGVSCIKSAGIQEYYRDQNQRIIAYDPFTGYQGTVCADTWDDIDADVFCRQQGFSGGHAIHLHRDFQYSRAVFSMDCTGTESNLTSCSAEYIDHTGVCQASPDAGAVCNGNTGVVMINPDGRVIVQDGNNTHFGTICANQWDDNDASVLCRHLGLSNTGHALHLSRDYVYNRNSYGVHCLGHESNLYDCPHDSTDMTNGACYTMADAGVMCNNNNATNHNNNSAHEELHINADGRVVVLNLLTGIVSSVCGYQWDDLDANVLCRHLNRSHSGSAYTIPRDYSFNRTVYGIHCSGIETNPFDCPADQYDYSGQCQWMGDAAVDCHSPTTNNSTGHTGVVMINPDGRVIVQDGNNTHFGTICANQWDDNDASVLCRHLGLSNTGHALHLSRDYVYNRNSYGVHCLGHESNLYDCPHDSTDMTNGACYTMADAGVMCNNNNATNHNNNSAHEELHINADGRVVVLNLLTGIVSSVCGYQWDDLDANVLCRHLNRSHSGSAYTIPRDYSFNRTVYGIHCSGIETNPFDCPADQYDYSGQCQWMGDAAVDCHSPTTNNSTGHTGVVMINPDGRVIVQDGNNTHFGTICANQWDDNDASVLCRHLGLSNTGHALHLSRDYVYNRNSYGVHCLGHESNLYDCPHDSTDMTNGACYTMADAGVMCNNNNATNHNNNSAHEELHINADGRVVVLNLLTGIVSSVCGYQWDDLDANVLCRHLNRSHSGSAYTIPRDYSFNRTVYGIHCSGYETNPFDCPADQYDYSGQCQWMGDAAVDCHSPTTNNSTGHTGVVMINPDGRVIVQDGNNTHFGTICANQWDDNDASVLCRHLGLSNTGHALHLSRDYVYNRNSYGVHCLGHESNLYDCPHDSTDMTNGACYTMADAGVMCNNNNATNHNNNSAHEELHINADGRVVVLNLLTGIVSSVCGYQWDDLDANVLCRHLNRSHSGSAYTIPRDYSFNRTVYGIHCSGIETNPFDCPADQYDYSGQCQWMGDAAVDCHSPTTNNSTGHTGVVMINPDGRVIVQDGNNTHFGTICANQWDDNDASVLCRHLGLSNTGHALHLSRDYVYNRNSYGVHCLGHESNLYDCPHDSTDMTNGACYTMADAGVMCNNNNATNHNNNSAHEVLHINADGRVVVLNLLTGIVSSVCGYQWDDLDANVLCRHLNRSHSGSAYTIPRDYSFNRTVYGIHCSGIETNPFDCPADQYDYSGQCQWMGDAAVDCHSPTTNNSTGHTGVVMINPDGRVIVQDGNNTHFGTICANQWDDNDASVLCRHLGLSNTGHALHLSRDYVYNRNSYGVHCLGHESNLYDCPHDSTDMTNGACYTMADAGVMCNNNNATNHNNNSAHEELHINADGRVVVLNLLTGIVSSVCGYQWDDLDANVLCRHLNRSHSGSAYTIPRDYSFNRTVYGIHCSGYETNPFDCPADQYDYSGQCQWMGDAAVDCHSPTTNNSTGHTGVVMINPDGRVIVQDGNNTHFGTICANQWDDNDASVLCRHLGLSNTGHALHLSRDYVYNRNSYGVHCLGHESNLYDCPHDSTDMTNGACYTMADAGVMCNNNNATNHNNNSAHEELHINADGRVVVLNLLTGIVSSVCGYQWDDLDANVLCRHLNRSHSGSAYTIPRDYSFNRTVYGIHCSGIETNPFDCPADQYDYSGQCQWMGDAAVDCHSPTTNNSTGHTGVVMINPDGRVIVQDGNNTHFGTICANQWDDNDASVLCRHLGLSNTGHALHLSRDYVYNRNSYGVHCLGHESNLYDCPHDSTDMTNGACYTMADAGVMCNNNNATNHNNNSAHEELHINADGRVVVLNLLTGIVSSVCGYQWDDLDANVLCRHLNRSHSGSAYTIPRDYSFNRTVYGIHCSGIETNPFDCPADQYDYSGQCQWMGDAAVDCHSPTTNNSTGHTGVVMINPDGRVIVQDGNNTHFGTICANQWDDNDANVLCRHLGLSNTGHALHLSRDYVYNRNSYGVHCLGHESNLYDCPHDSTDMTNGACYTMADAGVMCNNNNATNHNNNSAHEELHINADGRVVVLNLLTGIVSSVCGYQWDDLDANVLCRHLNRSHSGSAYTIPRDYSFNRTVYGIHCSGYETNPFDCPADQYDYSGQCQWMGDAAVDCHSPTTNNSTGHTGVVMINPDGRVIVQDGNNTHFGTICANQWDDNDASVLCRHLGLSNTGHALHLSRDYVYNRNSYGVHCLGHESNLYDCPHDSTDMTNGACYTMADAGVMCNNNNATNHNNNSAHEELHINADGRVVVLNLLTGIVSSVCGYQWDDLDANVLCRHLNRSHSGSAYTIPRDYSFNRTVYGIHCSGIETNPFDCPADQYDYSGQCQWMGDAAVDCHSPTTNNSTGHTGVVMINPDGRVIVQDGNNTHFGTICANQWDDNDASVLCRHLGLSNTGHALHLSRDYVYNRNSYGVHCLGHESNLYDCPHDSTDMTNGACYTMADAGVMCNNNNATNHNNNSAHEELHINADGRVVVLNLLTGIVSSVCGYQWDDLDANVLCRHLNRSHSGSAYTIPRDYSFNRTVYGIHCSGYETNPFDCPADQYDYSGQCQWMGDAAVDCHSPTTNNSTGHTGVVMINPDGRVIVQDGNNTHFGTICANQWDDNDASVLCRHLGLSNTGHALHLSRDYVYNRNSYGVHCLGHESNLYDCPHDSTDMTNGACYTMADAGVMCNNNNATNHNNNSAHEELHINADGRVVVLNLLTGIVSSVCGYQWDDLDANVLCRHLNRSHSGSAYTIPRDYSFNRTVYGIHCSGIETNPFDCPADQYDYSGQCQWMGDAAVDCHSPTTNNSTGHTGVVMINPDGRVIVQDGNNTHFGTICANQWDDNDASVLCRHLGLSNTGHALHLSRDYVYNRNSYGVHCLGHESNLYDCPHDSTDMTNGACYTMADAGVMCNNNNATNHNNNSAHEELHINADGRVVVLNLLTGIVSSVCGYQWDDLDANVLCRHLNRSHSGSAYTIPRDYSFNRTVYGIHCSGYETNPFDCPADQYDYSGQCQWMGDAAVDCHSPTTNNSTGHTGVVMINPDGRVIVQDGNNTHFGTICANQWDDNDASVLCRHLGLSNTGHALHLSRDYVYNRNSYGVHCLGHESNLYDCPHDSTDMTNGACYTMADAGVMCNNNNATNHNNNSAHEELHINADGRVVVLNLLTGIVSSVCGYQWDDLDANVLCRHLNRSHSGSAYTIPRDYSFNRTVYGIHCSGIETNPFDCPADQYDYSGQCQWMGDAAVDCHSPTTNNSTGWTQQTSSYHTGWTQPSVQTSGPTTGSVQQTGQTTNPTGWTQPSIQSSSQSGQTTGWVQQTSHPTGYVTTLLPVQTTTSALGHVTTASTHSSGQVTTTAGPGQVTSASGHVTTTSAPGQVTTTSAPGQVTTTSAPGQVTTTSVPVHVTTSSVTGQVTTTSAPGQVTTTSASGQVTTTSAPGQATTTSASGHVPTTSAPGHVTTTSAPGQVTTTSAPGQVTTTSAPGQVTTTSVPGQVTTTSVSGQVTTTSAPGQVTTTSVPGQVTTTVPGQVTTTSASGQVTTTSAPGQVTTTSAPGQVTTTSTPGQVTTKSAPGQVTTTSAPGQVTTTSAPGQVTTTSVPGQVTTTSVSGQVTTTSAPGQVTTTSAPGQVTTTVPGQVTTTSASGQVTTTSAPGQVTTTSAPGQVTTTSTPGQVTTTSAPGQVTTTSAPGQVTTTSAPGQVTTTSAPGQVTTTSALGQVTTTSAPGQVTTTSASGQVTTTSTPGQVTTTPAPGQVTTSAPGLVTTTSAPGQVTSTSAPGPVTTTATHGQVTTLPSAQATTVAPGQVTSTSASAQTTTLAPSQTTSASGQATTTDPNCQPGSGSCFLTQNNLGGGAESNWRSTQLLVLMTACIVAVVVLY